MKVFDNNKPYALYCRVSTDKQTNDNQKIRLLQFAIDNNLRYDLYEEIESTRKSRPVKQELMESLRKGDYKGVIVYKIDRWARSFSELILNIEELNKKNIDFISISDNLDFSSATGQLHFQILSAFTEFERSLISERTREGIRRAREQGKTLGRPKGSKDKKRRKRTGYLLREAHKRKGQDKDKGIIKSLDQYIN